MDSPGWFGLSRAGLVGEGALLGPQKQPRHPRKRKMSGFDLFYVSSNATLRCSQPDRGVSRSPHQGGRFSKRGQDAMGVSEMPRSLHPASWSRNFVSEVKSSLGIPPGSPASFPSLRLLHRVIVCPNAKGQLQHQITTAVCNSSCWAAGDVPGHLPGRSAWENFVHQPADARL